MVLILVCRVLPCGHGNSTFHAFLDDGTGWFQSNLVSSPLFGKGLHLVHMFQIKAIAVETQHHPTVIKSPKLYKESMCLAMPRNTCICLHNPKELFAWFFALKLLTDKSFQTKNSTCWQWEIRPTTWDIRNPSTKKCGIPNYPKGKTERTDPRIDFGDILSAFYDKVYTS